MAPYKAPMILAAASIAAGLATATYNPSIAQERQESIAGNDLVKAVEFISHISHRSLRIDSDGARYMVEDSVMLGNGLSSVADGYFDRVRDSSGAIVISGADLLRPRKVELDNKVRVAVGIAFDRLYAKIKEDGVVIKDDGKCMDISGGTTDYFVVCARYDGKLGTFEWGTNRIKDEKGKTVQWSPKVSLDRNETGMDIPEWKKIDQNKLPEWEKADETGIGRIRKRI